MIAGIGVALTLLRSKSAFEFAQIHSFYSRS